MFSGLIAEEVNDHIIIRGKQSDVAPTERSPEDIIYELRLTPGGATFIDGMDLSSRQVQHLGDALRYVPGVWAMSGTGTDSVFISIRGSNLDDKTFDLNGIKVIQDGLPLTAADGNTQTQLINPLASRHLVIYRGANALEYGASTLGGTIELTSPTAHATPSSVSLRAGSHDAFAIQATAGHVFNEHVDAILTIDANTYGGYRQHSEQDALRLYGNIGLQLSEDIATRLFLTALNLDMEIPGSLTREEFEKDPSRANASAFIGDYQRDLDVYRLASLTSWDISDTQRITGGLSYENQELFHPIVAKSRFFGGLHVQRNRDDINGMIRYGQQLDAHDFVIGINGGVALVEGTNSDNEGGIPGDANNRFDNSATNFELYALDRWSINTDWTVMFGAQFSTGRREVADTTLSTGNTEVLKDTYSGFNPRAGLVYHVDDHIEIYGQVSRLFEPPTLSQLEDEGAGGNP